MLNGICSSYLSELIPQRQTSYRQTISQSNSIPSILCQTNSHFNSFLPSTIRDWNDLPNEVKQTSSINSFKLFLDRDLNKSKSYMQGYACNVVHYTLIYSQEILMTVPSVDVVNMNPLVIIYSRYCNLYSEIFVYTASLYNNRFFYCMEIVHLRWNRITKFSIQFRIILFIQNVFVFKILLTDNFLRS
ncbi:hypothetical protein KUTeg_016555 [Tegillarca granosa]|uniref:Uncharacterized protein n=1 Tax=Tegillarca granosa TaxID=220873 RepID=A0ABQ9ER20_TEGGR|nr:hypothetical protein KUTeg_016555 [Tegillarca granosa]